MVYRIRKTFDYFINLSADQITSDEGSNFRELLLEISAIFDGRHKSFIRSLDKENSFPELLLKFFGKKIITKSSTTLPPKMQRLLELPDISKELEKIKILLNNEPQNTKAKQRYQKIQDDIKNLKPKIIRDKMEVIEKMYDTKVTIY